LSDSTAITVSSGATYNVNASDTVGSIAGAGTISSSTSGSKTLSAGANDTSTSFSGVIQNGSGTIALTKVGSGTLTLTGNNTFTGLTTVSAGTLKFAPSTNFDMTLSGGIVNNAEITFDGTNGGALGGTTFITGASGSGTWNITGTTSGRGQYQNRLILNGTTTISGLVTVTNYGNFWLENTAIDSTSAIYLNGANTYLNIYALSNTVTKIGALSGTGVVDSPGNTTAMTLSLGNDNGTASFDYGRLR
jgi:autotransporter-associated beta strand protein